MIFMPQRKKEKKRKKGKKELVVKSKLKTQEGHGRKKRNDKGGLPF